MHAAARDPNGNRLGFLPVRVDSIVPALGQAYLSGSSISAGDGGFALLVFGMNRLQQPTTLDTATVHVKGYASPDRMDLIPPGSGGGVPPLFTSRFRLRGFVSRDAPALYPGALSPERRDPGQRHLRLSGDGNGDGIMANRCIALLVTVFLGCGGGSEPPPQSAADRAATVGSRFEAPDGGYVLELPSRWTGHYRVDSLSTSERGRARPGVLVFSYLPSDSAIRPQVLAVVAVYDSASWVAVRDEGGPPPGDSVVARAGRVYVVGQPQSNPFPAQSADAVLFGLLQLKPAEVTAMVLPR